MVCIIVGVSSPKGEGIPAEMASNPPKDISNLPCSDHKGATPLQAYEDEN